MTWATQKQRGEEREGRDEGGEGTLTENTEPDEGKRRQVTEGKDRVVAVHKVQNIEVVKGQRSQSLGHKDCGSHALVSPTDA